MLTEDEKHERNLALLRFIGWRETTFNVGNSGLVYPLWIPPGGTTTNGVGKRDIPDLLSESMDAAYWREKLRDEIIKSEWQIDEGLLPDGCYHCSISGPSIESMTDKREPFISAAYETMQEIQKRRH